MFDFLFSKDDAIVILKNDHSKVKDIFEKFENTNDIRRKRQLAEQAIEELKIHAEIEEKIFYPTVRKNIEKDIMNEADEEHHVAKLLIAELEQMKVGDPHWEAKFIVLAENIRHHIREEEGEMLPKARSLNIDFHALGQELQAMKQKLKRNGIPPSDEAKLMASNPRADSPAKAAKAKVKRTVKSAQTKTARRGRPSKAYA